MCIAHRLRCESCAQVRAWTRWTTTATRRCTWPRASDTSSSSTRCSPPAPTRSSALPSPLPPALCLCTATCHTRRLLLRSRDEHEYEDERAATRAYSTASCALRAQVWTAGDASASRRLRQRARRSGSQAPRCHDFAHRYQRYGRGRQHVPPLGRHRRVT